MLFPRQLGAAYLLLIGSLCHQALQIPDHRLLVHGRHLVQEIVPFYGHQDGLTLGVVRTGSLLFLGHDGSLLFSHLLQSFDAIVDCFLLVLENVRACPLFQECTYGHFLVTGLAQVVSNHFQFFGKSDRNSNGGSRCFAFSWHADQCSTHYSAHNRFRSSLNKCNNFPNILQ